MSQKNSIAILDFGGQYCHLIANRVRRLGVYCDIFPCEVQKEQLEPYQGIIFSGGPNSVYTKNAPRCDQSILKLGKPILGICYGHQLICHLLGGQVQKGSVYEYGKASAKVLDSQNSLFPKSSLKYQKNHTVWMSHGDKVVDLPENFIALSQTNDCEYTEVANLEKNIYGLQFHPEVTHTLKGTKIIDAFLEKCGLKKDSIHRNWNMQTYRTLIESKLKKQCQNKKVFLLVSGGVDSTVCFALLNHALGPENVKGLHIDNGFMRKAESQEVMNFMQTQGFNNLEKVDASKRFLTALKNVYEPEKKRKIIGNLFLEILDDTMESMSLNPDEWIIAQGTTYPDMIESGGTDKSATIKTHHNRVPKVLERLQQGKVIEPICELYKDEVRQLGLELKIPKNLVFRHPFPGPGLAVRLLCQKNHTIKIDQKINNQIKKHYQNLEQNKNTAEVLPIQSVGVQGDTRTYAHPFLIHQIKTQAEINSNNTLEPFFDQLMIKEETPTQLINHSSKINRVIWQAKKINSKEPYKVFPQYCNKERLDCLRNYDAICTEILKKENQYHHIWQMPVVLLPLSLANKDIVLIRPISSMEAMTAEFYFIPTKIINEIWERLKHAGAGALFYDITSKPPGTIEWE